MNREIGGEFWLTNRLVEYIKSSPNWINVWGNNVLTSSGSGALSLMLEQVEDKVLSKTVLLPAYTCESVILPFIKDGYICYFYDVDENLKPNLESIETYLKERIGIFLHMGYYGFSTNSNLEDTVKKLKNKDVIIIEDITHTLFSRYKRFEENDYYVASLRKWLGIPSGGFLTFKDSKIQRKLNVQYDFSNIRKEALLLKGEYIKTNNKELKQEFLDMFKEAEMVLDEDICPYAIDNASLNILNEVNTEELAKKRKENFLFLLNNLKESKLVKFVFKDLPKEICPMFFPIYLKCGRNQIRRRLIENDIYCPIHWPIPHFIDLYKFPKSKKIYESIISIPCDQRYGIEDMSRIIKNLKDINYEYI